MNLTKKLFMMAAACRKPSWEESDMPSSQSRIPTATKVITPETRCKMDAIAVTGNRIVCRSRLTGLCFFTFLPTQLLLFSFLRPGRGSDSVKSQNPYTSRAQTTTSLVLKRRVVIYLMNVKSQSINSALKDERHNAGCSYFRVIRRPGGSIGGSHSDYNSRTIPLITFPLNSD